MVNLIYQSCSESLLSEKLFVISKNKICFERPTFNDRLIGSAFALNSGNIEFKVMFPYLYCTTANWSGKESPQSIRATVMGVLHTYPLVSLCLLPNSLRCQESLLRPLCAVSFTCTHSTHSRLLSLLYLSVTKTQTAESALPEISQRARLDQQPGKYR